MDIEDIIEEKYNNWVYSTKEAIELNIEEAKHILANDIKIHYVDSLLQEAYEVVLNELERLKKYEDLEWQEFNELSVVSKELEKKDKVINEMSNFINTMSNELVAETGDNNLEFCKMQKCIDNGELDCKECIKEYFTNKAENVGE